MPATVGNGGTWVNPDKIELRSRAVGALPAVNAVLARLGFDELVASYLPEPDGRCELGAASVIGVLVRNLALGRRPLYGLGAWAARYEPALLGLTAHQAGALNDDRVGRALESLFSADRASLLTSLGLRAIAAFGIDCSELHNDSTSITLYGAYRAGTGASPPRPARGHSKDHRLELKQLVEILTVSADGAVPLTHRLADGNTEDSTTHIDAWDQLVAMLGRADFVYVADCKLATRDNLDHIAGRGGRFLTVLPRTRKEDQVGRAWMASGAVAWKEISRRPGKRRDDPPQVYWAAEALACSAEGYRIVWIRSSTKRADDAAARLDRIERARTALGELERQLASPRCQLRTRVAVEDAAAAALAAPAPAPVPVKMTSRLARRPYGRNGLASRRGEERCRVKRPPVRSGALSIAPNLAFPHGPTETGRHLRPYGERYRARGTYRYRAVASRWRRGSVRAPADWWYRLIPVGAVSHLPGVRGQTAWPWVPRLWDGLGRWIGRRGSVESRKQLRQRVNPIGPADVGAPVSTPDRGDAERRRAFHVSVD